MMKRYHLHRVAPEHAQMQQNAQAASEAMPAARAQIPLHTTQGVMHTIVS